MPIEFNDDAFRQAAGVPKTQVMVLAVPGIKSTVVFSYCKCKMLVLREIDEHSIASQHFTREPTA